MNMRSESTPRTNMEHYTCLQETIWHATICIFIYQTLGYQGIRLHYWFGLSMDRCSQLDKKKLGRNFAL